MATTYTYWTFIIYNFSAEEMENVDALIQNSCTDGFYEKCTDDDVVSDTYLRCKVTLGKALCTTDFMQVLWRYNLNRAKIMR